MTTARLLPAVGLLAVCVTAAGCSSGGSSAPASTDRPASTSPSSTSPAASPATTTSAPTSASAAAASPGRMPSPGSRAIGAVAFGTPAEVWDLDPKETDVYDRFVVTLTAKQGKPADLADVKLDATQKNTVPFYVLSTVQNATGRRMPEALLTTITARNAAGEEVQHITVLGEVPACPTNPDHDLNPGETQRYCDIYLVPQGQRIASASMLSGMGERTWK